MNATVDQMSRGTRRAAKKAKAAEGFQRGRPSRARIIEALDQAIADLQDAGGLPRPHEAQEIWKGIWFEEVHNSTAIEGNTLILKQVRQLLEEGRAVGNKELSQYLEVQGYSEAAEWVYSQAVERGDWAAGGMINLTELRNIHKLAVEPVWLNFPPASLHPNEGPGAFRQHDIEPFPGGMRPPPFPEVPALVDEWMRAANTPASAERRPIYHLAALHAEFERIHPFRDGNGRTGRLALNLLLVRHGFPPVIIHKRNRSRYLAALDRADKNDIGPLAEMLAREVRESIHRFLLPALAGPMRTVPLSALATKQVSKTALTSAAKRGRLRAMIQNGQWYSTRKWVDEYLASRHQRH